MLADAVLTGLAFIGAVTVFAIVGGLIVAVLVKSGWGNMKP